MTTRDQEEQDLRIKVMQQDLELKRKQAFWESPKGFAAVIAVLAVTIGAIGGVLGYQIGRSTPQTVITLPPGTTITAPPAAH